MYNHQHLQQRDESMSLWKVAARVPWPALLACFLYLPGIVLWAVYSLRCKAHTFLFLTTVAPVAQETVDAVTNTVNTTLFTLAAGGTFIFALLLLLAIARSIQRAGVAPNSCCPCARPTPSSYYLYRVFNMGFNIIVFFVNLAIMFLMMGAFLWLVVAFAANLSIRGGVRAAADAGVNPLEQGLQANQTYTTVVSSYERQLQQTPACVANSTWLKELNSSISKILEPIPFIKNGTLNATNGSAAVNTLLCPQTCLNLGSFATLFRLQQSCICSGEQLLALQEYSATVSADAGVCLAGVMLIYLACSTLHAYLIGQYVHAGYDYKAAKQRYADFVKQRRRQHALTNGSVSNGSRKHPKGGGGPPVAPGGPMTGVPASSADESMLLSVQDVEMGYGTKQHSMRRQLTDDLSYADQRTSDDVSNSHKALASAPMEPNMHRGSDEVQVQANGHAGISSDLARHSSQGTNGAGAAVVIAGQLGNTYHLSGNGTLRGRLTGPHSPGASVAALHRSSPLKPAAGLRHSVSSPASGSLAAVASFNAWERSQQEHQSSPGSEPDAAAAASSRGLHQQGQLVGGSHAATGVGTPSKTAMLNTVHARNESKSSAGSIREILLGAVPLDHIGSSYGHQQQLGHQQPAATTGSGVAAAAAGRGSSDNNAGVVTSSNAIATMGSFSGSRDGASHKPSSSGGSYESMIYHSPRNSDSGSNIANPGAHLATAAAAGAAGGLFELPPFIASKSTLHKRQQQQEAFVQQTLMGQRGGGRVTDRIPEIPAELPSVTEHATTATGSTPTQPAVQQVTSAVGVESGIDTPSPSSDVAGTFYDTGGSKLSSKGDTIGSLNSSSHRSRHSHRRLPAFDLTDTAHHFLTVEGLEQQQQLQRELGSRSHSPAGAVEVAASSAEDGLVTESAPATGTVWTAEERAVTEERAVATLESAPEHQAVPDSKAQPQAAAAVTKDWPDMSEAKTAAAVAAKADAAASASAGSGGTLHIQVAAVPLPVRRNISLPAALQVPSQVDAGLDDQHPGKIELVSGQQQQQQQRSSFVSPLLPPPEQQQMLLQHQQQQLALLLQQEDEQQWQQQLQQQQSLPRYQRHWSTPTAAAVAAMSARSSISPSSGVYSAPFQSSAQLHPSGAFSTSTSLPLVHRSSAGIQQNLGGPASNAAALNNSLCSPTVLGIGDETLLDADSVYTTPEPSPVTAGMGVGTPQSVGRLMGHSNGSSSLTRASLPPLFVGGGSASDSGIPGSSHLSSLTGSVTPNGVSTPQSVPGTAGSSSSLGSPATAGIGSQFGGNGVAAGSLGALGVLPPTIPEVPGAMYTVDSGYGQQQQQQGGYSGTDVATLGSPLERRRSGYRSSMRKGMMAYDQYKYRQRYQQEVSSPLDPRTELSRRYRNRVPAV